MQEVVMKARFQEWVIEGEFPLVKGFVWGALASRGKSKAIFFSREADIKAEAFADQLLEWVGLKESLAHLIVPTGLGTILDKVFKDWGAELGLKVKSRRPIKNASFQFSYHAYSRKHALEFDRIFKKLPVGLKSVGYKVKKQVEPSAKGAECYAPYHDFEAQGSGRVEGDVGKLIIFRQKLKGFSLIETEDIVLTLF